MFDNIISPVNILAFGAHPDDIELSASGTLLKHIDLGYSIGLVDMTQGELGTRGNAPLRLQEAKNAAAKLGAKYRVNLNMADGFFKDDKDHLIPIIRSIRTAKPDIVLINAPSDRHPDHGRAASLCSKACFYAGLPKIETQDFQGKKQVKWRPRAFYHYIQDRDLTPDFVVDISPYMDKKIELIKSFKSQFFDPNNNEPETPLTNPDYFDLIRAKNKTLGRPSNFAYAEGFIKARMIGIHNLMNLW